MIGDEGPALGGVHVVGEGDVEARQACSAQAYSGQAAAGEKFECGRANRHSDSLTQAAPLTEAARVHTCTANEGSPSMRPIRSAIPEDKW